MPMCRVAEVDARYVDIEEIEKVEQQLDRMADEIGGATEGDLISFVTSAMEALRQGKSITLMEVN